MKLYIALLFLIISNILFSQEDKLNSYFEKQSKTNLYEKNKKFKGPKEWEAYQSNVSILDVEDKIPTVALDIDEDYISEEDIHQSRLERYGKTFDKGGNATKPEVIPPEPIEIPEINVPDLDIPSVDLPEFDPPTLGTWQFWKNLMILFLIACAVYILFQFWKNIKASNTKVETPIYDDWNPTLVTKSELETKLENAEMSNNYRECIRIHFMFILKELINKQIIDWKLEKTNFDYLLETKKYKGHEAFEECVRIYDLVWYGDYEISNQDYDQLKTTFESYNRVLV